MFDNIIQLNEQAIKTELKDLVKRNLPKLPSMSAQIAVWAIAQDIICATSKLLPAMLF